MSLLINPYRFASATFDPLSIDWHTVFWADDPNWTNPGDGNAVLQWDDASGNGRHATQDAAGKRPLFRSAYAALGGRGAVDFDGGNDELSTDSFTLVSQPATLFLVTAVEALPTSPDQYNFTADIQLSLHKTVGWFIYAGTVLSEGAASTTDPHALTALFDGADSSLRDNGSEVAAGDAGTAGVSQLTIGNSASKPVNGGVGFLGLLSGELSTAERGDLEAWASSYYGI